MTVKDYIFHCKNNNRIKRIPTSYWQQVASGKMPIPGFEGQRVHIAIIRTSQSHTGDNLLKDKQFDSYILDKNGFIQSPIQHSPQETLYEIFFSENISDDHLADLVTQFDKETSDADPWLPTPEQCDMIGQHIGINLSGGKGWSVA